MTQTFVLAPDQKTKSDEPEVRHPLELVAVTNVAGRGVLRLTNAPSWAVTDQGRAQALRDIADRIASRHSDTFERLRRE